jgi:drug/metabolite transporter (DMT)-like permease
MNYLAPALIFVAVAFEVIADIFFKKWALAERNAFLIAGLALYFIGTVIWAYSLKFEDLSKAIVVFVVLNLILAVLAGVYFFGETLTAMQKVGVILGILSVVLIEL